MAFRTFLISMIGVDGSGKTTMMGELRRRNVLPGSIYVCTERWHCEQLLRRYHRKRPDGTLDFVKGSFARARPFATAMDLLHTYATKIEPCLGRVPYIVVDRYVLSAMAYFGAMGHRNVMHDYFAELAKADLTIYLRADMKTLRERYRNRGFSPDEAPELMRRHSEALDAVVQETVWPVVSIDNVAPFSTAYQRVENAVLAAVQAFQTAAASVTSG